MKKKEKKKVFNSGGDVSIFHVNFLSPNFVALIFQKFHRQLRQIKTKTHKNKSSGGWKYTIAS